MVMGIEEMENAKRNRERIERIRREEAIVEAYKSNMLVQDICNNYPGSDGHPLPHANLYDILHKYKVPLRSNDPNHPASSLKTRTESKIGIQPPKTKTYYCKYDNCDFFTMDITELRRHNGSVHSWHYRTPEEQELASHRNDNEENEGVNDKKKESKLRLAFRWLVANGIEPSYEVADELLSKYLQDEQEITMLELLAYIEGKNFTVEDLRRANFGIYIGELLDSMDDFKKQDDFTYEYVRDPNNKT